MMDVLLITTVAFVIGVCYGWRREQPWQDIKNTVMGFIEEARKLFSGKPNHDKS